MKVAAALNEIWGCSYLFPIRTTYDVFIGLLTLRMTALIVVLLRQRWMNMDELFASVVELTIQ